MSFYCLRSGQFLWRVLPSGGVSPCCRFFALIFATKSQVARWYSVEFELQANCWVAFTATGAPPLGPAPFTAYDSQLCRYDARSMSRRLAQLPRRCFHPPGRDRPQARLRYRSPSSRSLRRSCASAQGSHPWDVCRCCPRRLRRFRSLGGSPLVKRHLYCENCNDDGLCIHRSVRPISIRQSLYPCNCRCRLRSNRHRSPHGSCQNRRSRSG
jgi:hypothetical protein